MIALAILGVIATFTIPKILATQANQQKIAVTKEALAMVSGAYQAYQTQNTVTSGTGMINLLPYLNYIKYDSSGTPIDNTFDLAGSSVLCNATNPCIWLHSGALLRFKTPGGGSFFGTSTTNAVWIQIDPNGTYDGSGDLVMLFLYYDGHIIDYGNIYPNTVSGSGTYQPTPQKIPDWFQW